MINSTSATATSKTFMDGFCYASGLSLKNATAQWEKLKSQMKAGDPEKCEAIGYTAGVAMGLDQGTI